MSSSCTLKARTCCACSVGSVGGSRLRGSCGGWLAGASPSKCSAAKDHASCASGSSRAEGPAL
eukprot:385344-Pyramimonas_sp.AAC.1